MRSETRFERLAGPRMTVEEFMGETPSVYERLEAFGRLLEQAQSMELVKKEFRKFFPEAK